jgi:hypothetical protein
VIGDVDLGNAMFGHSWRGQPIRLTRCRRTGASVALRAPSRARR